MDGLILRTAEERDLPVLLAIRNDAALQELLLAQPRPNSVDDVRAWIARRSEGPLGFRVIALRGEAIGFVQLTDVDRRGGVAHLGICLAPPWRGAGRGRGALRLLEQAALGIGLRKLLLRVRADNAPAIGLYVSCGYRCVGRVGRHASTTGDHDVVGMEKILDPGP